MIYITVLLKFIAIKSLDFMCLRVMVVHTVIVIKCTYFLIIQKACKSVNLLSLEVELVEVYYY